MNKYEKCNILIKTLYVINVELFEIVLESLGCGFKPTLFEVTSGFSDAFFFSKF